MKQFFINIIKCQILFLTHHTQHYRQKQQSMNFSTSNNSYGNFYGSSTSSPYKHTTIISKPNKQTNQNQDRDQPEGLDNLTNTCYISAVLQMLFLVVDQKLLPENQTRRKITNLFFLLKKTHRKSDYEQFKEALEEQVEIVQGWDQQDAQELLIGLLEQLSKENQLPLRPGKINFQFKENVELAGNLKMFKIQMEKIQNSNIINNFYGQILRIYKCPEDKQHKKTLFERYQHISLSFPSTGNSSSSSYTNGMATHSLKDLLSMYLANEQVEGVQCQKCNKKRTHTKQTILYTIPKYFILHLARFKKGYFNNEKINAYVKFDSELRLDEQNKQKTSIFQLKGLVHHIGNLNRGHYYAQVCIDDSWYTIDDQVVKPCTMEKVENQSKSVYMLLYEKI